MAKYELDFGASLVLGDCALLLSTTLRCHLPSNPKSAIIHWMIRWRKWFLKITAILFVLLVVLAVVLFFFPQPILRLDSGPATADVIIVLGGGSGDAHERPEHAAELYGQRAAPRILVSGAGDDIINAHIMMRRGVPASVIQLEPKSKTTRENAEFSIAILRQEHIHSAIIVTSWYHSRRALKTFEYYGPDIKFYSRPSDFGIHRRDWQGNFSAHVYWEYVKLPGYWIRYGVWPF
jgi:uncharacterized SAM-binding protein YcdF (DUF218 family)